MKAIELVGDIDDRHRLLAEVPKELPAGPVRLIVLLPEEDDAGALWAEIGGCAGKDCRSTVWRVVAAGGTGGTGV